jgi:hypothetical protein
LQRQLSASSSMKNNVVAAVADERDVIERQISNMSLVNVQRRSTDPPAHTNTTTNLASSTPHAPRRVSSDGNGGNIASPAQFHCWQCMIRQRLINQKSNDDRNKLGRDKHAERQKRRLNVLKQVAWLWFRI